MYAFGVYMVKRIGNYGYERILKVDLQPSELIAIYEKLQFYEGWIQYLIQDSHVRQTHKH